MVVTHKLDNVKSTSPQLPVVFVLAGIVVVVVLVFVFVIVIVFVFVLMFVVIVIVIVVDTHALLVVDAGRGLRLVAVARRRPTAEAAAE
jgi:hypothetical protein